jgi:lysine-arginine-ornithine-binding protein
MIKLLVAGLGLLATLAAGAGAEEMRKVRMGTEGAYPPFNYIDKNGKLAGFDIEIGNALCAAAKVECTWATQDWEGIIPGLQAEKYDTIVASMSITEERKEVVDFTDKYYRTPATFVAEDALAGMEISTETLKGKVIGVQSGTVSENFVRDNYGDVTEIRAYDTQEQANLDLVAGRVDLVFADRIVLDDGFLKTEQGKGFGFVGPNFSDPDWFGDGIGIAVRKGDDELRDLLNAAIRQILADGTYKKINDKYFNFDVYGG